MKDYVKAFPMGTIFPEKVNLVSEVFDTLSEAEHFAKCFKHNYKAKVKVRETFNQLEYVVFMYRVEIRLIRSNFKDNLNCYEFANWESITR